MSPEEIQTVVEQVLEKMGVVTKVHPDAPLPAQEWLSIKNIAVLTGISACQIRRSVTGGTLIASDLGTKDHPHYRISRDNLKKWIDEREGGARPVPRKSVAVVSRHHKPKATQKQPA